MKHRSAAVASRALELALRGQSFQVNDVQRDFADAPSRQTIYRVLDQLAEDDWLRCEGKVWHPDLKARMLADVDDEQRRAGTGFSAEDLL
jgi:hypothetical protein